MKSLPNGIYNQKEIAGKGSRDSYECTVQVMRMQNKDVLMKNKQRQSGCSCDFLM